MTTPLPAWIDRDAWDGFVEFRRRQEKQSRGRIAWTPRAETLVIKELYALKAKGHCANASLDQSVMKGYTDVYAPKDKQTPDATVERKYNVTAEAPMSAEEQARSAAAKAAALERLGQHVRIRRVA